MPSRRVQIEFDGVTVKSFPNISPFTQKDTCFVVKDQVAQGEHRITISNTGPSGSNVIFSHLMYY